MAKNWPDVKKGENDSSQLPLPSITIVWDIEKSCIGAEICYWITYSFAAADDVHDHESTIYARVGFNWLFLSLC